MNSSFSLTEQFMAKITGFSLILMAIVAGFGYGYAFNGVYVAHDKIATMNHLNGSSGLLRMTIVSFILILLLDVLVAWSLYGLLKKTSPLLALLSAWLRLIYSTILGTSISYLITVLTMPMAFPGKIDVVMWQFHNFLTVWSFGLIIFGVHLVLLSLILFKARMVPTVVSCFTFFAGFCYLLLNLLNITFSGYAIYKETLDMVFTLPMALGELGFAAWLLFKRKQIST